MPTRFKSISKRAKLILSRDEGSDSDFKRNDKFDSSDLVAFANSATGGTLLLGVKEVDNPDGSQKGVPVRCALTDGLRLKILDRARSCIPPLDVQIFEENGSDVPFVRIEIPSGPHKPYCTGLGTYKIRVDGANKPITPPFLLRFFVEREATAFVDRFRAATAELETNLGSLSENIKREVTGMAMDLEDAHRDLSQGLDHIGETAGQAFELSEDAAAMADSADRNASESLEEIKEVASVVNQLSAKIDGLLIANKVRDLSISPSRLNGLLRAVIFGGKRISLKERRARFFGCLPTAQEEDWEEHLALFKQQAASVKPRSKKSPTINLRNTSGTGREKRKKPAPKDRL